jgi:small subunit ribosomal protein S2
MIDREKAKLHQVLSGVVDMKRLPGMLFIVDIKKEHIAVNEAKKMGIPIVGMVDTNSDPTLIDFPIPANDDAAKSISLISGMVANVIAEEKQKLNDKRELNKAVNEEKEPSRKDQRPRKRAKREERK